MALKGARPYLDGACTVCNFVLWKSRSAKDGTALLDVGEKRRRRPAKRMAEEELDAALIAGAIASGSARKFWETNLWDMNHLSGPALPYTLRMVFRLRTWKSEVIFDVAWRWAGVRGRTPRRLPPTLGV